MLFNSYPFVFLPITLAGFFALRSRGLAIAWLSLVSLFSYGLWNPVYVGPTLASITFNYLIVPCLYLPTTQSPRIAFASPWIRWSTTSRSGSARSTPAICVATNPTCWTVTRHRASLSSSLLRGHDVQIGAEDPSDVAKQLFARDDDPAPEEHVAVEVLDVDPDAREALEEMTPYVRS